MGGWECASEADGHLSEDAGGKVSISVISHPGFHLLSNVDTLAFIITGMPLRLFRAGLLSYIPFGSTYVELPQSSPFLHISYFIIFLPPPLILSTSNAPLLISSSVEHSPTSPLHKCHQHAPTNGAIQRSKGSAYRTDTCL